MIDKKSGKMTLNCKVLLKLEDNEGGIQVRRKSSTLFAKRRSTNNI